MEPPRESIYFGWHRGSYTPYPGEIRAACRDIQENWTPDERRRRAPWAYQGEELSIPTVHDLDESVEF